MAYFFNKVSNPTSIHEAVKAPSSAESQKWYKDQATALASGASPGKLMNDPTNVVTKIDVYSIGKLFMFYYDPKMKDVLPFYDTFPLVFPIGFRPNGFLGLNLHYLPPVLRAKLMNSLYETINNDRNDETTALQISYQILNSAAQYNAFRPCVKQYLWDYVAGGRFLRVEVQNWDNAVMLPLERFQKASKDLVWKTSQARL